MSHLIDLAIEAIGHVKYNGCLIERDGKYWKWAGTKYPTLYMAKRAIDKTFKTIGDSIK